MIQQLITSCSTKTNKKEKSDHNIIKITSHGGICPTSSATSGTSGIPKSFDLFSILLLSGTSQPSMATTFTVHQSYQQELLNHQWECPHQS